MGGDSLLSRASLGKCLRPRTTRNSARGATDGASKIRRAITFLRVGCRRVGAALWWGRGVDVRGVGSAARNSVGNTSILQRADGPWTHGTITPRSAAGSNGDSIRTNIAMGVIIVTASGAGDGGCGGFGDGYWRLLRLHHLRQWNLAPSRDMGLVSLLYVACYASNVYTHL